MKTQPLCIFGEVLFDMFPDGQQVLGGAPFNVAWHLQAFGAQPQFISRIGQDPLGEQISSAMTGWGMSTETLQLDPQLPTGTVQVIIEEGEPSYEIVHPSAWDAISIHTESPSLQTPCNLLYYGSLALRNSDSAESLKLLLAKKPQTVFVDVNLRPPWYQEQQVLELIRQADWVKLNQDEFNLLFPGTSTAAQRLSNFTQAFDLQGVVLTMGKEGAMIYRSDGEQALATPEQATQVVDTVGAGDALTSVVIFGIINQWPIQTTIERAQAFASRIVAQRGATVSDPMFYQEILSSWN